MSDHHSNSECENILYCNEIEKSLISTKEHSDQLDHIIKSKGKLVVYVSIIYGAIIAIGLIYIFMS
ncbi:MAG: hypothetical protein ABI638_09395 [Ignavibacteriota bacterium]